MKSEAVTHLLIRMAFHRDGVRTMKQILIVRVWMRQAEKPRRALPNAVKSLGSRKEWSWGIFEDLSRSDSLKQPTEYASVGKESDRVPTQESETIRTLRICSATPQTKGA